jgi:hypothetical protein
MVQVDRHRRTLVEALAWSSPRDGRWVLPVILIAYVSTVAALDRARGWTSAWESLGVGPLNPPFADARFVMGALDSLRLGFDPYVENVCDPWRRPMDYPRVWLGLAPLGLTRDHTVIVGIGLAAAYFGSLLCWTGRLNPAQGLYLGLFVCAPHVMWAVERGNTDLVIFVLLASSLTLVRRYPRMRPVLYLTILFSSILKLYPLAAMLALGRERPRHALAWGAAITTACVAYFLATWPDLALILRGTRLIFYKYTLPYLWTYGRMSLFEWIGDKLRSRAGVEVPPAALTLASLAAVGGAAITALNLARKVRTPPEETDRLDGFLVGSGIYVGTFLLGINYEYKFIFILFLFPQAFDWVRDRGGLARPARLLLASVQFSVWTESLLAWIRHRPSSHPPAEGIVLQELANWLLFVVVLSLDMVVLRGWAEGWFRRPGVRWRRGKAGANGAPTGPPTESACDR